MLTNIDFNTCICCKGIIFSIHGHTNSPFLWDILNTLEENFITHCIKSHTFLVDNFMGQLQFFVLHEF